MTERYPGYNVLDKRDTLSWNEPTRRVVEKRLNVHPGPRFFSADEWRTLCALCDRILPQPKDRPPVPIPAYIDEKMQLNQNDGFRFAQMPPQGEAWKAGLAALDAAARDEHSAAFHELSSDERDALLKRAEKGELDGPLWRGMPSKMFFSKRVLHDVVSAYYAHPTAWSEIGWGGPASPRGYVRLNANQRDPWEASEAHPGREDKALLENKRVV